MGLECFGAAVAGFGALGFIFLSLQLMGEYEGQKYFVTHGQLIALAGIVMFAEALLYGASPGNLYPDMCSMACLLVVAIIDEQTGYVYDCFGIGAVIICGVLALQAQRAFAYREILLIGLYMLAVCLAAALYGLGAGDVPVYLALMLYYLRYASFPADAAMFMLLASQLLFGISAFFRKKRYLPLVPYICLAHLITLCLWGK